MQNSFLLWGLKEWILVGYPLTEGTLLGSFLLLTFDEIMCVKLCSAVYPQMMYNNAGKQCS